MSANPIGAEQRVSVMVSSAACTPDAFAQALERAVACDTNDGAGHPELSAISGDVFSA